ncbi:MAG: ABC transporter permease [Trueperaceae bacterium]
MRWFPHLCGGLVTLFLVVFFLYPLGIILQRGFTVAALREVLQNPFYLERLLFTFYQASLSTLLTVSLALPSAFLFARYTFWGKRFFKALLTLPFVMPIVVVAIGLLSLIGPRGFLGINLRDTFTLLLLAHVFYNYVVVVRVVSAFLEGQGAKLREAAAMLGAGFWQTLYRVTLPVAAPAILSAAALVFVFCFTSFGVIILLTPSVQFATLEVQIYRLTSSLLLDWPSASVLALLQLVVVGGLTFFYTGLQRKLSTSLSGQRPLQKARGLTRLWLFLTMFTSCVLLLAPLLALTLGAFTAEGRFPSLGNVRSLLEASRTLGFAGAGQAVFNSLRFAVSSMCLALLLGFACAYAVVRGGWTWLDNISLLPLATSAITLGLGYLLAFPLLRTSPWGLTLAHTLLAFPFVTHSLLPALRGLPPNLSGAAATLGASPWHQLWRVELPLLRPSLVTAASFAFAISLGEFGAGLVIQNQRFATLPIAIADRLGRPGLSSYGSALVLAFVLMVLTVLVMLLLEGAEGKGRGQGQRARAED